MSEYDDYDEYGDDDDFYHEPYSIHDDEDFVIDGVGFADPGGRSALRAATPGNPRIYPCPTCKQPNCLTAIDKQRGYQCDRCADRDEF